ncbi:MAG TPA: hypothetical protein VH309_11385 [Elusimicrobiota bacterium]|nr:hypothetical protein [Elusimicrobiota bacterium]
MAVPAAGTGGSAEMKKRVRAAARREAPKRGRRSAPRCPCCACAPCACEKTCLCQELKADVPDDEFDEPALEDELRLTFLRHAEQAV